MNLSQKKQIEKFCEKFYKKLDFAHNLGHMNKTIKIAEFIAKKENANIELVRLGARLHQFHDNMEYLRKFLVTIQLETEEVERLLEFAKFRPHKNKFKVSKEMKIVADADYLQVMGPYGAIREIICNTKIKNKTLEESVQRARNVEKIFYNNLQTKTARLIIQKPHELMKKFWKIYDNWEKDKF